MATTQTLTLKELKDRATKTGGQIKLTISVPDNTVIEVDSEGWIYRSADLVCIGCAY